jgi:hypothetical protein
VVFGGRFLSIFLQKTESRELTYPHIAPFLVLRT